MSQPGMLSVMRECRNFFNVSSESGEYTIENGVITLRGDYVPGQYILITGSILNDGVYLLRDKLYMLIGARGETFNGTIYGLRVKPDFVALCERIERFNNQPGADSAIVSESVAGLHSYTVATNKDGMRTRWQDEFKRELTAFRTDMFTNIKI